MRVFPALALATGIAAGLTSGQASALEACPMERAVYALQGAPDYRLEFRPDAEMSELSRTASPTIYFDVIGTMRHQSGAEFASFMFYVPSSSMRKGQAASVTASDYLGEAVFPAYAFREGIEMSGMRWSGEPAPSAIIIAGAAEALGMVLPEDGNTDAPDFQLRHRMPEAPWILTECR
ncbi:MAG: hypothetical protein ACK4KX_03215 [Parvibaculum sp.]|uniref:hypothetical protein n=1 Tax=Parvibaculum sp. TaxID=2024848 RepID=UPI00391A6B2E